MKKSVETPGFKFLINGDNSNRAQLTAVDNFTGQAFQSEWTQLHQINTATICAAFKNDNPHIQYSLQREEKTIDLIFCVNFNFLSKISQNILLTLMDSQESMVKIQFDQIWEEVGKLQQMLEFAHRQRIEVFTTYDQPVPIPAGSKLIQFSGAITASEEYDNEIYYDSIQTTFANIDMVFFQGENQKENKILSEQTFTVNISTQSCYEYPFKVTHLVNMKSNGRLLVKIRETKMNLLNYLLTVTSL